MPVVCWSNASLNGGRLVKTPLLVVRQGVHRVSTCLTYNTFACVLQIKQSVHLVHRASKRHPKVLLANTMHGIVKITKTALNPSSFYFIFTHFIQLGNNLIIFKYASIVKFKEMFSHKQGIINIKKHESLCATSKILTVVYNRAEPYKMYLKNTWTSKNSCRMVKIQTYWSGRLVKRKVKGNVRKIIPEK